MPLLSMSSRSSVDRASAMCSGSHEFDSCRVLRFSLCPTLVSCWSIHLSLLEYLVHVKIILLFLTHEFHHWKKIYVYYQLGMLWAFTTSYVFLRLFIYHEKWNLTVSRSSSVFLKYYSVCNMFQLIWEFILITQQTQVQNRWNHSWYDLIWLTFIF